MKASTSGSVEMSTVTQYLNEATGALYGVEKPYCYVPINVIPHPLGRVGQYRGFGKVQCQIF